MSKNETWAQRRENWDIDDWDAYHYIEECKAEDARDAEYLGCYDFIF